MPDGSTSVSNSMDYLEFISHSPEQTQELGENIGRLAMAGDIYLLIGNLGAGKTCLTQGIARGLDIEDTYVASPSFVLVRELHGRLPLYHIDLYRLNRIEEISELGLDDYLYGQGVCVIEWAEKGLGILPGEHLLIEIKYISDNERQIRLKPAGRRYLELQDELKTLVVGKGQT